MDDAFKIMKNILAADELMTYSNHNIPFCKYLDASDYQMGAVIVQQKCPVDIVLYIVQNSKALSYHGEKFSLDCDGFLRVLHCMSWCITCHLYISQKLYICQNCCCTLCL